MPVIVTIEIPGGSEELYRRTHDKITAAPWFPTPGFLAHAAGPDGTGGFRVIDFWDSVEAFQAFERKARPIYEEMGIGGVIPRVDEAVEVVVPPRG
ncbi:hypothetical protein SLA_4175 [Streptomyces laurentii]|jgi:hypothetical protein|uniref:ABM domain-containing protein n=1 Tax=Streptomyces laurentii TaxID=39478 RepID=A0A160P3F8_STRLU|nr:hypothetical protein SLA_4175 [Streptomyces laurentii]